MPTCTRKLEFDAGHRVMRHESKCVNMHGHRYTAEITAQSETLDELGRVIDFGKIKAVVGKWIDDNLDHAFIANPADTEVIAFLQAQGYKLYVLPFDDNPTAEVLADHLLEVSQDLLEPFGVGAVHVRLWETPNAWADAGSKP